LGLDYELTFEEKQSRSDLIHKLNQSKIRAREAKELRTLLNREKQIISLQGNCLAFLAVTFLIGYVEDYLGVNVSEA
jgi:shikimate kinase